MNHRERGDDRPGFDLHPFKNGRAGFSRVLQRPPKASANQYGRAERLKPGGGLGTPAPAPEVNKVNKVNKWFFDLRHDEQKALMRRGCFARDFAVHGNPRWTSSIKAEPGPPLQGRGEEPPGAWPPSCFDLLSSHTSTHLSGGTLVPFISTRLLAFDQFL